MKRVLLLIVGILLCTAPLQAQSLSDMLSSLLGSSSSSTSQPAEKPVYPTAKQIVGKWVYQQLDMDYSGDSAIASMGVATAKTQLSSVASIAKLSSGKDYVKLSSNGTFHLVSGERKIEGTYSYIPAGGRLLLTAKEIKAEAVVTLTDGASRIMFNAKQAVLTVEQHSDTFKQNTTFQLMKEVILAYPGITVGAIMKK